MNRLPVLTRSAFDAYNLLAVPVWLFSADTLRIVASNFAAQDWLGYDAKTLHSMTIADIRPEEDRERIVETVRAFVGTTADAGPWTMVTKSGDRLAVTFTWRKVVFEGVEAIVASIRDMTQIAREQAQSERLSTEIESLRRKITLSRDHLTSLFDMLPGKMAVLTPGGYRVVAATNDYIQAAITDRDTLLGRSLFETFRDDPNDPEADGVRNLRASLRRVEALRATDVMGIQRYPVRGTDGVFQDRSWLLMNKPVFDDTGRLIYIIHRAEDVTGLLAPVAPGDTDPPGLSEGSSDHLACGWETRVALLGLQERDKWLETAEKLLKIGSWRYDPINEALIWSDRVFDIYGVPRHSAVPDFEAYVDLVHPEDQPDMVANYRKFIEEKRPVLEFQHRIIRADGSVTHVRGVGARHRVDGNEIVIGFVQDIGRFIEAEEGLMEAARQRKTADRLAKLGTWRLNLAPMRVTWSAETAELHDEPADTSPTLDAMLAHYVPEHRDRIREAVRACAADGHPFDEVLQTVTAKGRRLWVRAIGEAVRNADQDIVAVDGAFQDISELVEARDAANAMSRRLGATLESISDAFFLLDRDWRFSYLNSQAEKLLQRSRADLVDKVVWQVFPEAVGSTFDHQYFRAVDTGQAVRFQEYFAPLETWFQVDAFPTPEGLAVYFSDVTRERKRDEDLRILEAAVERQNDILVITEAEPVEAPDGPKIVYVNAAFERRTGFSRAEVIGNTPRILQGPRTQRHELDRIGKALRAMQPVRAELINYTKSGEEFWLDLDIVPVADETGKHTHFVAVERDITERKNAVQALQDSEERFRLIARATGTAVWDWDVARDTQWWSDGLQEIFGHETDATEAIPTIWRANVHPDDQTRVDIAFQALETGEASQVEERYHFRRKDGSWALVQDRAFAIRSDSGNLVRIIGSLTDISEGQVLEERLRQAQKMEAVGQLTGGVAHDFNNLLTVIMGNSEILCDALETQPNLQKFAAITVNAAERGAELTQRLLAFSRKQPLEPRVLDVGQVVQGLDGLLRRTLPENIDIEIIRAGGVWKAEIDPGQFESALLNMAINARDAMPGGGNLTIEIVNAVLDDDYCVSEPDLRPGQYVMIAMTDTGAGIPRNVIGRIFEPFFTTKEVGKGSGLGLSMVFGFVKQSGGHIRVYSEPGEGTTFKLYFPRSTAKDQTTTVNQLRPSIVGGKETILVVEDDDLVCDHVIALLDAFGYRSYSARNGKDALEILARVPQIDLLFTDVVMPGGMGGRELATAARAMRPGLKVLFTSGYTENSIVHNGRLDAGVELISKPYRREQLSMKLRKVLEGG